MEKEKVYFTSMAISIEDHEKVRDISYKSGCPMWRIIRKAIELYEENNIENKI